MNSLAKTSAALLGFCLILGLTWPFVVRTPIDADFTVFRVGASLHGDSSIYNPQSIKAAIGEEVKEARHYYLRWPWYSFVTYPLSMVSHQAAYFVWRLLALAAVLAAILLWPLNRDRMAVAACWSMPVFWSLASGQDTAFVLALAAVALRTIDSIPLVAGISLAVSASIKPHLVVLVVAVLVFRKSWEAIMGFASGVLALYLSSACLAGWSWPIPYLRAATSSNASPNQYAMAGLGSLWSEHPIISALFVSSGIALTAFIAHRRTLPESVSVALALGILLSPHSYPVDCILLLPLATIPLSLFGRYAMVFALSPVATVLVLSGVQLPLQLSIAVIPIVMFLSDHPRLRLASSYLPPYQRSRHSGSKSLLQSGQQ